MKKQAYSKIFEIVGPKGIIEKKTDQKRFVTEWRGQWEGYCDLVVRPKSTTEVSNIIKICDKNKISVTPQSGNTGLVGGGVPFGGILLSLDRMDKIIDINHLNCTLTCQSGTILKNIQKAAEQVNRLFPLSLASEESCRIGGNLATNAGGVHVLRYGNARDLVLGLEIVLPSGKILQDLRCLRKDNTGYNWKHLFLGSEGTLGIITSCTLKLFPLPKKKITAFIAIESISKIIELFNKFGEIFSETLSVFEFMNALSVELAVKHINNISYPFDDPYPNFLLVELATSNPHENLREDLERMLSKELTDGLILNALLAESISQRDAFWRIRDNIPEAQNFEGGSIKNDIAVPVTKIPEFIEKADHTISKIVPNIRPVSFGHIGDGNIHYNLSQPSDMRKDTYLAQAKKITHAVNQVVFDLKGTFSAEHGIGLLKKRELLTYRSKEEIEIMQMLKKMVDPNSIMNPGKILPEN